MSHLHIDATSGLSGDKLLSALIELHGTTEPLETLIAEAFGDTVELRTERVTREGIAGTHLRFVEEGDESKDSRSHTHDHSNGEHSHDHAHGHTHDDDHEHSEDSSHSHEHDDHTHGRQLNELLALVDSVTLPERAKERSIAAIDALATVEGKMHDKPKDEVHFHELSGVDTFLDIAGIFLYLELLDIQSVSTTPIGVGAGEITIAHGTFSVPAPATAELLQGLHIVGSAEPIGELTTPTGAVIMHVLQPTISGLPSGSIEQIGYGAGMKNFHGLANVVRLYQMTASKSATVDTIAVVETNIDDMQPELLPRVKDQLLELGVVDVSVTPIQMKKERTGWRLTVLCTPELLESVKSLLFTHTSTFGLRSSFWQRDKLEVSYETVETQYGPITVKYGSRHGEIIRRSPEYDDIRRAASTHNVSELEVYTLAIQACHTNQ